MHSSAVPYCSSLPLRSGQRAWATWQQPLELVSIRAMYSAPFSRLLSRAANFLLLGYTNCSISIPYLSCCRKLKLHQTPMASASHCNYDTTENLCTLCLRRLNSCNFRFSCSFCFFPFQILTFQLQGYTSYFSLQTTTIMELCLLMQDLLLILLVIRNDPWKVIAKCCQPRK